MKSQVSLVARIPSKIIDLREHQLAGAGGRTQLRPDRSEAGCPDPRSFPVPSSLPQLPSMIPDEILDFYGFVFCQGGFRNLGMTFEGFLSVVAAVKPTLLSVELSDV
jgi:hypothetical protein